MPDGEQPAPLPPVDAAGNRSALAFAKAAIAQGITRDRSELKMTRAALAFAARIHLTTLNRAERGEVLPSSQTLARIDAALARERSRAAERATGGGADQNPPPGV